MTAHFLSEFVFNFLKCKKDWQFNLQLIENYTLTFIETKFNMDQLNLTFLENHIFKNSLPAIYSLSVPNLFHLISNLKLSLFRKCINFL